MSEFSEGQEVWVKGIVQDWLGEIQEIYENDSLRIIKVGDSRINGVFSFKGVITKEDYVPFGANFTEMPSRFKKGGAK